MKKTHRLKTRKKQATIFVIVCSGSWHIRCFILFLVFSLFFTFSPLSLYSFHNQEQKGKLVPKASIVHFDILVFNVITYERNTK